MWKWTSTWTWLQRPEKIACGVSSLTRKSNLGEGGVVVPTWNSLNPKAMAMHPLRYPSTKYGQQGQSRKPIQSSPIQICDFYANKIEYPQFPNDVPLFKQISLALARLSMSPQHTIVPFQALAPPFDECLGRDLT
jgi:hypothetical protein